MKTKLFEFAQRRLGLLALCSCVLVIGLLIIQAIQYSVLCGKQYFVLPHGEAPPLMFRGSNAAIAFKNHKTLLDEKLPDSQKNLSHCDSVDSRGSFPSLDKLSGYKERFERGILRSRYYSQQEDVFALIFVASVRRLSSPTLAAGLAGSIMFAFLWIARVRAPRFLSEPTAGDKRIAAMIATASAAAYLLMAFIAQWTEREKEIAGGLFCASPDGFYRGLQWAEALVVAASLVLLSLASALAYLGVMKIKRNLDKGTDNENIAASLIATCAWSSLWIIAGGLYGVAARCGNLGIEDAQLRLGPPQSFASYIAANVMLCAVPLLVSFGGIQVLAWRSNRVRVTWRAWVIPGWVAWTLMLKTVFPNAGVLVPSVTLHET